MNREQRSNAKGPAWRSPWPVFAPKHTTAGLYRKFYSLLSGKPENNRSEPPVHRASTRRMTYFSSAEEKEGKLGVFWHTQGAGKSFSMIFYARKIIRKLTGNFTFVVITDREDLDGQIYRNFLNTEDSHKKARRPSPRTAKRGANS